MPAGPPPTVVLDGAGGSAGRAALHLFADGGRLVQFGRSSGDSSLTAPADLARRGIVVLADAIGPRLIQRPGGLRELETTALGKAAAGDWAPLLQRFPLGRADAAHAAIEARATIGKTVLVP